MEKFIEGLLAFLHLEPEAYIKELIEEKTANNKAVENAISFLQQNTHWKNYIFPSMEVRPNKDGYSSLQKPNNKIDLRNKLAINLRRENPELKFNSGKFICLMPSRKLNELEFNENKMLLTSYYESKMLLVLNIQIIEKEIQR